MGAKAPANAQECRSACDGEFGAHGLAAVPSCLCRTRDRGKDCRDGNECEGECVLDPVRSEPAPSGPSGRGYFVGKCSEFVKVFGCVRRIARGARDAGAVDLQELPPQICVD